MSTVDPNIHPHWAAEAKTLATSLNTLDYYQVLGLEMTAPFSEIKGRYHALQREYHPDTFFQSPDMELRAAVMQIAKRIAESYVILRDEEKRQRYNEGISGPERATKLRFTEESEQQLHRDKQKAAEEVLGKTAQGRNLVQKAIKAIETGDLAGASRDLQTALLFESGNPDIKRRLDDVKAQMDAKKKKRG